jgi:hypothetical protein
MAVQVNPPYKSKINYLAGTLALLGVLTDPKVMGLIPQQYAGKIMIVAGAILIVVRSFFTAQPDRPPIPDEIPR